MKFFYAPRTCALASHIALEECGTQYEAVRIDFGAGQQRSLAFLAVNPKGRVPTLQTDRGVLTENPALLAYIAQRSWPNPALAPMADPFAFAQVQAFNCYLSSTVHVAHAHGPRASRWSDDPEAQATMRAKVAENMTTCFRLIEQSLFMGPWVRGDQYTVCDPYLFTLSTWLEGDGVSIGQFPKVGAHYERMLKRPAVTRTLALYAS